MRLRIEHVTRYRYSQRVQHAIQALCLTPRTSMHQTVHEWQLTVPGRLFGSNDGFGNTTHTWTLGRQVLQGSVRAAGVVDTHACPDLLDDERIASPLIFATLGELVCERAGVLNLGIEGIMTVGAFTGWFTIFRFVTFFDSGRNSGAAVIAASIPPGLKSDQSPCRIGAISSSDCSIART